MFSFFASLLAFYFLPINIPANIDPNMAPEELLAAMLPQGDIKTALALVGVSLLLNLLLTAPLSLGTHRFYLGVARGENPKFISIFAPFTNLKEVFSSCALVVISTIWKTLLYFLLLVVPTFLIVLSPSFGPLAITAGFVLYLIAFVALLIQCTPFTIAPFVLADKPERGAFKSILLAMKRLKGAKCEFLVFNFSFALWYLFFGLNAPGVFFIQPYISTSMAGFYLTADACKK